MKRIFFAATALLCQFITKAQTDSLHRDSFYLMSPVEIRATRVSDKMPFSVSNVSSKQIQKQNLGAGLPYLLGQTPSVVVSSDDGVGVGYSGLRIRGTDMTRINVTFNGIPVNDAESQGAFFVDIPDIASSTSSIQIQRGVGSSTNGSGAFGGSINISNTEQSKSPSATISNAYGSFNTWKHTLKAATGLLPGGFQFDMRLSKISADGYIDRASTDLKSLQFLAGWTSKDDRTNIKFNLLTGKERTGQAWNGVKVAYTDKDNLSHFDYEKVLDETGRTSNTLGQKADGSFYNDQTDNYQQDYYQLFINHKFNPYWSSNVSLFMTRGKGYYNEYKDGYYHDGEAFSDYGLPNYIPVAGDTVTTVNLVRQLWLDNYYYGSVFSASYNKKNTSLAFGGAYTLYDAKQYGFIKWAQYAIPVDYKWYDLTACKRDFNLFGKWQQQLAAGLYSFADLQFRTVSYKINGFRKNPDVISDNHYNFFNPKVGINYLLQHDAALSKFFASFAIANKEPNRDDYEAAAQKPKPEHLLDWEAGYEYSNTIWNAGITGYYMQYKDQLILTGKINDVGAYTRVNVPESYRAGIELTAGIKPAAWLQLNANATFSKNKIKAITQYGDDYDNGGQVEEKLTHTDIALSPNTIVGATAIFEPFYTAQSAHHFFIDLVQKYVGRQYLDNAADRLRSINPYALTDIRLRYQFQSKTFKDISVIAMLNNVFNKKYETNGYTFGYRSGGSYTTENYYFPQAGCNWNVGVSFTL